MDLDTWEQKADLPAEGRNHPAINLCGTKFLWVVAATTMAT